MTASPHPVNVKVPNSLQVCESNDDATNVKKKVKQTDLPLQVRWNVSDLQLPGPVETRRQKCMRKISANAGKDVRNAEQRQDRATMAQIWSSF